MSLLLKSLRRERNRSTTLKGLVHTPKHGSWLNLIETFFVKISRTFLKNIRVQSKHELRERILKGIEEVNAEPVVQQWKNFDFATN